MEELPFSSPNNDSDPKLQIEQNVEGDQNQMIGQVLGGMVVYGTVIYNNPPTAPASAAAQPKDPQIGANPYKGLLAFQETDGDRFFGRDLQIQEMWEKFRNLQEQASTPRLLTIYGPSGSGKSSLAKAGLIPELSRRPLPGQDRARVAVLVPGSHPLESLAIVLARIATHDPTPAAKTREFVTELSQANAEGVYDGLRRIADALPDITISPLIVLVDQWGEVFTLCEDAQEREAFIGNLLCAAADRSKRVSVIITLRSDLLGFTQKHPLLNQLIAAQGYLVAAMTEDGLREAIVKPAELAGHPLDLSTVNLLIKQTVDREGALPLLQFALSQIWEGLAKDQEPAQTLKEIGGVGGALAGKAQRIYDGLTLDEQAIAQRVFLGLVQLGEGTKDTRRRTPLERVVAHRNSLEQVQAVIDRFASPGTRLITLANDGGTVTAEVTHEALFDHWQQLKDWLDGGRSDLRFQRRLDEAATIWQDNGRPEGNLWRSPDLDLLRHHQLEYGEDMTRLQREFFEAAERSATNQRRVRRLVKRGVMTSFALVIGLAGFAIYQLQQAQRRQVEQLVTAAEGLLATKPVEAQVHAIAAFDAAQSILVGFPKDSMSPSIQNSLLEAMRLTYEKDRFSYIDKYSVDASGSLGLVAFNHDGTKIVSAIRKTIRIWNSDPNSSPPDISIPPGANNVVQSAAFSRDGTRIVGGGSNGTIQVWDTKGKLTNGFSAQHTDSVSSVAFNDDGTKIVSGSRDKTIRVWDIKTGDSMHLLDNHKDSVASVAFSHDGTKIVSGSHDNTIRIWDVKTKKYVSLTGHTNSVTSVAFNHDGTKIVSGSLDRTVRIWDAKTKKHVSLTGHTNSVTSVAFNHDGTKIVSGSLDNTIRIWDAQTGDAIGESLTGHDDGVVSVSFNHLGTRIVSGGLDNTVRTWDTNTKFFGHKSLIFSIAFDPKNKNKVISGSRDKSLRIWDVTTGKPSMDEAINKTSTVGHTDAIYTVAFSPDGTSIISGGYKKDELLLWDRAKGTSKKLKGHTDAVFSASFSRDGTKIVTGSHDKAIRIWDKTGKLIHEIKGHTDKVYAVAFSSDGKNIVSGGKDKKVKLWDVSGKKIKEMDSENTVRAVVFGKNNETIISAGEDKMVRIWNIKSGKLSKLEGHEDLIYTIAFCREKNMIVSGSRDKTLRFWDATTAKPIGNPLKDYTNEIQSVTFSEDCEMIINSSRDDTLRKWKTAWAKSPKELLEDACKNLQYHSIIAKPKDDVANAAKHQCEKYWGR